MANQTRVPFYATAQEDKALVMGNYRLIDHPVDTGMNPRSILAPHREHTLARMQACDTVLCIQDGSDMKFGYHPRYGNLALIGKYWNTKDSLGLHMHLTLAVDAANGVPLGVPHIEWDAPDSKAVRGKALEERKSARWLRGLRDTAEMASSLEGVRVVAVMDSSARFAARKTDIFGLFAEARRLGNVDLLVRAQVDRSFGRDQIKLLDRLAAEPEQGRLNIHIQRTSAQKSDRDAEVVFRWRCFDFPPPEGRDYTGDKPVTLTVLNLREPDPPDGADPLNWTLLTSLPISSLEQAEQVLEMYLLKQRIVEWRRALKFGCRAELFGYYNDAPLERTITVKAVIAWRVAAMVMLGRETPELPAEVLFSDIEIKVLTDFASLRRRLTKPDNLGAAITAMAAMNGYLNRKSDPPPGHKLIWRSCTDLVQQTMHYKDIDEMREKSLLYQRLFPDKTLG